MTDTRQLIHDVRNPLNGIVMNVELAKMLLGRMPEGNAECEKVIGLLDKVLGECQKCEDVLERHK